MTSTGIISLVTHRCLLGLGTFPIFRIKAKVLLIPKRPRRSLCRRPIIRRLGANGYGVWSIGNQMGLFWIGILHTVLEQVGIFGGVRIFELIMKQISQIFLGMPNSIRCACHIIELLTRHMSF